MPPLSVILIQYFLNLSKCIASSYTQKHNNYLFRNILGFFATSLSISIAAATKIKHLVSIKAPTFTPEN